MRELSGCAPRREWNAVKRGEASERREPVRYPAMSYAGRGATHERMKGYKLSVESQADADEDIQMRVTKE